MGCYVQARGEEIMGDACVDIAIGNDQKSKLTDILSEYFNGREDCFFYTDIGKSDCYERISISGAGARTRAYVKVQEGCNQFCSYCIIPYTRGRIRSRSLEDTLEEVSELAAAGVKEIVLTGIHLSSYGLDKLRREGDYGGQTFAGNYLLELIKAISHVPGILRIRLSSLEPRIITREFAVSLAKIPQICPHFHLSLQSGCNSVLKRMNRRYTVEEYAEKCKILREVFDNPAITTDVIVGFPQETDEEFEATYDFLAECRLYEMHVFKYSARQGTVAASMPGQVKEQIKAERSARLLKLTGQLSAEYRKSLIGREVAVLLEEEEEIEGANYLVGYTKEYVRAALLLPAKGAVSGTIYKGRLTKALTDEVMLFEPF